MERIGANRFVGFLAVCVCLCVYVKEKGKVTCWDWRKIWRWCAAEVLEEGRRFEVAMKRYTVSWLRLYGGLGIYSDHEI